MILKAGKDHSQSASYRPISLCSTLGKLLERLFLKLLNRFMDDNQLRRERQCGFARGRSAQESIIKLADDVANAFKGGRHLVGVFIDMEKAFDKVWHAGVIFKLLNDSAPLHLIKIIASFLIGRKFQIRDGEVLSTIRDLEASAPQGGTSSPNIYTYYMKDMPGSDLMDILCNWSDGSSYADDNAEWRSFCKTDSGFRIACAEIQRYLDQLQVWGSRWRLLPSPAKTEVMVFSDSRLNRNREANLSLYGQKLKTVKEVRFLGTLFDQGLTWSNHIDKLVQKATPRSIQICRLAKTLRGADNRLVGQLINSMIVSIFDYSSVAWITASDTQWKKINQCQMRTLKAILRVPRRTADAAVLDRVNTGTYREIITERATRRFENLNNGNRNMSKFQNRCVNSDRSHRQRSPYEILTELADLEEPLQTTKCIICTYSPERAHIRLDRPNTLKLCQIHRLLQN